jgi:mevalonate kinase
MMLPDQFKTKANGKFLISGEYAVLDGALALAVPLVRGQTLEVTSGQAGLLDWQALEPDGTTWFECILRLSDLELKTTNNPATANGLQAILQACKDQNALLFSEDAGYRIRTQTDFPREWGLGTSSTLIAAISQWTHSNPYRVLEESFGGSGYDIACAFARKPILYQRNAFVPFVEELDFQPSFADQLYFVYLGKKQNSREGIQRYRELSREKKELVRTISQLTEYLAQSRDLQDFQELMRTHEQVISKALQLPPVQATLFSDFWGQVKSMGAWGGDFVLVASDRSDEETRNYFEKMGLTVCFNWDTFVLTNPK